MYAEQVTRLIVILSRHINLTRVNRLIVKSDGENITVESTLHALEQDLTEWNHRDQDENIYGTSVITKSNIGIALFSLGTLLCVEFACRRYHWKTLCYRLFVTTFVVSVVWNYLTEYQRIVAEHMLYYKPPPGCMGEGQTLFGIMQRVLEKLLVIKSIDDCTRYAQTLVVEPIFKSTPLNALSITITTLILTPLQMSGKAINILFRTLFEDIPIVMMPVLTILCLYLVTLVTVITNRYSIASPLLELRPTQLVKEVHRGDCRPCVKRSKHIKRAPYYRALK